jgi:hypothetical protein
MDLEGFEIKTDRIYQEDINSNAGILLQQPVATCKFSEVPGNTIQNIATEISSPREVQTTQVISKEEKRGTLSCDDMKARDTAIALQMWPKEAIEFHRKALSDHQEHEDPSLRNKKGPTPGETLALNRDLIYSESFGVTAATYWTGILLHQAEAETENKDALQKIQEFAEAPWLCTVTKHKYDCKFSLDPVLVHKSRHIYASEIFPKPTLLPEGIHETLGQTIYGVKFKGKAMRKRRKKEPRSKRISRMLDNLMTIRTTTPGSRWLEKGDNYETDVAEQ